MVTQTRPAATGQTRPQNVTGVTRVPVAAQRSVTYVFHATTATGLRIPYAVAVNGTVLARFAERPSRVDGSGGRIVERVNSGSTVSLYLNSDAHPSFHNEAVYSVTVGDRDVRVDITERTGKHSESDRPTHVRSTATTDEYTAPLTGDIWMRVSHRYTTGEVAALVPPGTSAAVVAAVRSIYAVLPAATLTVTEPATQTNPARTLRVTFNDSQNPNDNIVSYTLLRDGLTRVHPGGFAALIDAALASAVTTLRMTSCWRPMLGSIAHRAGLGLDVDYVGAVRLNRQELRTGAPDTANVSTEERRLFAEFQNARAREATARAAAARAPTPDHQATLDEATRDANEARRRWNAERDANEPTPVRDFRTRLLASPRIAQLFDPWFMDPNGSGAGATTPNMQQSGNERLHAHHLHVTVREPGIL